MDARALAELDHLRLRDEALASSAAQLAEVEAAVSRIRARAEAIDAVLRHVPRRADSVGRRDRRVGERSSSGAARNCGRQRATLAAARTDDDLEQAEKAVARAVDHLALAESALLRAHSAHEALESQAAELPAELTALEAETRGIAESAHLPELPPSTRPRDLADWASRSHAELFVALSQIDTQRERIIREANELATMLLGEATYGSTVAQALRNGCGPEPEGLVTLPGERPLSSVGRAPPW